MSVRRVSVFGATGSIGRNTVELLHHHGGARRFDVVALTGGRNVALLAEQARALKAAVAVTAEDALLDDLRDALAGSGITAAAGPRAIAEAADRPADWVMSAIGGCAGLEPGLRALAHGTTLALANKESMVAAGPLMRRAAAAAGATLLPVDSEHSAIFQALAGEDVARVRRLILTASGGPFRDWPVERLRAATPAQARAHPNWSMGEMISVDSASMFNKALEMIEARELYEVEPDRIEVLVHPQSIVHSLVEYVDGSMLAHLSDADMRFAIGYALNWPERAPLPVRPLDLAALGRLEFEAPDADRFPALRLGRAVMEAGGLAGAVFNAAKESAYAAFMAGRIGFLDMAALVEEVLAAFDRDGRLKTDIIDLETVLAADREARQTTQIRAATARPD